MHDTAAGTARASALIGALALGLAPGLVGAGLISVGGAAQAQDIGTVQSQILTLDPDRLFMGTLVGRRLTEQYEAERDRLIASNRELESELRAEEQSLTDARADMTPKQFRTEADAFDAKVRSIRQENDRKARDLERGREIAPLSLMRMAEPILVQIMRETGGNIILDNRQVLLRSEAIDITDLAITRVDVAVGDGSDLTTDEGAGALPEMAAPESDGSDTADDKPPAE